MLPISPDPLQHGPNHRHPERRSSHNHLPPGPRRGGTTSRTDADLTASCRRWPERRTAGNQPGRSRFDVASTPRSLTLPFDGNRANITKAKPTSRDFSHLPHPRHKPRDPYGNPGSPRRATTPKWAGCASPWSGWRRSSRPPVAGARGSPARAKSGTSGLRAACATPAERGGAVGAPEGPHEVARVSVADPPADLLHGEVCSD